MREQRSWVEKLQQGRGKDISRELFLAYTTRNMLASKIYPQAFKYRRRKYQRNFSMPLIDQYFKDWMDNGFIDKSKHGVPIQVNKKDKRAYLLYSQGYMLNLEPIFRYCKELREIDFSSEEKRFLFLLLLSEHIRYRIMKEYPKEDVINAVLKFYAKNYIFFYALTLADMRDFESKYKNELRKEKDFNTPGTQSYKLAKAVFADFKKEGIDLLGKKRKRDAFDMIHPQSTPEKINNFWEYKNKRDEDPKFIAELDRKILKALDIYPIDIR